MIFLYKLYLLLYAFILVVEAKIRAGAGISRKKTLTFILVKLHIAAVCIGVLVIFVKFAAFTAAFWLISVL